MKTDLPSVDTQLRKERGERGREREREKTKQENGQLMSYEVHKCGVCGYQRCISLSIAAMSSSATASVLPESPVKEQFNLQSTGSH